MATYIYETTDPTKPVQRFEIQQGMKESALTRHPESGEPIRRVITGGLGYLAKTPAGTASGPASGIGGAGGTVGSSGSCGVGCGCH
jgi:hypothetical protein